MADNPYAKQPPRAFWRSAIAEVSHFEISDLYRKKWDITPKDRISTAGSCFAQHIARNLARNGYNYQDFEPAPLLLPAGRRNAFGYGLFSARYGNVYTARQLRQLLERAFGVFQPEEAVWNGAGRFFDPFRPTIEPGGFHSEDEVAISRRRQRRSRGPAMPRRTRTSLSVTRNSLSRRSPEWMRSSSATPRQTSSCRPT